MQIRLQDLSMHGFRVEWPYTLSKGAIVWLKIPGLESMQATVAWSDNFQLGCSFARPVHPAVFTRIIDQFTAQKLR